MIHSIIFGDLTLEQADIVIFGCIAAVAIFGIVGMAIVTRHR